MTRAASSVARTSRAAPKQERALQTRERLLDVAGELLGEVGIERISTNMIAARAGVTPPALYRYFGDKYAVLEALGATNHGWQYHARDIVAQRDVRLMLTRRPELRATIVKAYRQASTQGKAFLEQAVQAVDPSFVGALRS